MFLLDSNIVIYSIDPVNVAVWNFVRNNLHDVSAVSVVEVLGYHRIAAAEQQYFEAFFASTPILPVSDAVIVEAVSLRQARKMALGDALIAATALTTGRTLVTRNTKHFSGITGLSLFDPV